MTVLHRGVLSPLHLLHPLLEVLLSMRLALFSHGLIKPLGIARSAITTVAALITVSAPALIIRSIINRLGVTVPPALCAVPVSPLWSGTVIVRRFSLPRLKPVSVHAIARAVLAVGVPIPRKAIEPACLAVSCRLTVILIPWSSFLVSKVAAHLPSKPLSAFRAEALSGFDRTPAFVILVAVAATAQRVSSAIGIACPITEVAEPSL